MRIHPFTISILILLLIFAARFQQCDMLASRAIAEEPKATSAAPKVTADELERLVEDLDADRYAAREHATQKLQSAGIDALPLLVDTADNGSYEASARALGILERWGRSGDKTLQLPTLERLAALKNHPRVQKDAATRLAKYYAASTLKTFIAKKGIVANYLYNEVRGGDAPYRLVINSKWKGNKKDLASLRYLDTVQIVAFHSAPVAADDIRPLAKMPSLTKIEIFGDSISLKEIEALKKDFTGVAFDIRRGAKLGIRGSTFAGANQNGAVVSGVEPNSAAEKAGLKPGDIITKFDGKAVADFEALTVEIGRKKSTDKATLEIVRPNSDPFDDADSETLTKVVTFDAWK